MTDHPTIPAPEFRDDNARRRRERPPEADSDCRLCGRPIVLARSYWIHVVDGGHSLAHRDAPDTADPGDCGWHPVGADCARRIPASHKRRDID